MKIMVSLEQYFFSCRWITYYFLVPKEMTEKCIFQSKTKYCMFGNSGTKYSDGIFHFHASTNPSNSVRHPLSYSILDPNEYGSKKMKILTPGTSCSWKDRKQGFTCCTTEKVSDTIDVVEPNVLSFYDTPSALNSAKNDYGQCFDHTKPIYIGPQRGSVM